MAEPNQTDQLPDGSGEFSTLDLLVKLVILPALVVSVMVLVVAVFGWLTATGDDVNSLVDALDEDGNTRWRAAVSLATVLADSDNRELKVDSALARRLIAILDGRLENATPADDEITLRIYLCRTLGEFRIPDPIPTLVKAAKTERDPREVDVRRSAIEALAVLASNLDASEFKGHAELGAVLQEASRDPRHPLRSSAAYTLGVVGGHEAKARLEELLEDGHPDVRYNAALGLARHGDVRAVDVLMEMLDPSESAGIDVEKQQPARSFKRTMILINALRAADLLASSNSSADLGRLEVAVERLLQAEISAEVRVKALGVLNELKSQHAKAAAAETRSNAR